MLELAAKGKEGEVEKPLSVRRKELAHEDVEPQDVYEKRVGVIKSLVLSLIDLTVHRRMISGEVTGEFADNEVDAGEQEPEDLYEQ